MSDSKRKIYQRPVITRVNFEDKGLVNFAVCRTQTQLERDADSCCNILPHNDYNFSNLDPS